MDGNNKKVKVIIKKYEKCVNPDYFDRFQKENLPPRPGIQKLLPEVG